MSQKHEQWAREYEQEKSLKRWAIAILVLLAILVATFELARAQWVYGDWTCALAECRKVIVEKAPASP